MGRICVWSVSVAALSLSWVWSWGWAGAQKAHADAATEPALAYDPVLDGAHDPALSVKMSSVVLANLEPSYIAYPLVLSGIEPVFLESGIAAHFEVHSPRWLFSFVLTPKVLVRMFHERSSPVRTPSYMPRFTAFLWLRDTLPDAPTFYASLAIAHHSNGQDGPFLLEDGSINHKDGSFSTNYLELSLYAVAGSSRAFGWSALSFEWHPGFNQEAGLRDRYGSYRLHLASTVLSGLELKGQLSVRLSAILDDFMSVSDDAALRMLERFPLSVRYTMGVPGIDLGLYASYYVGHDYYNIWFDRLAHVIEIGIAGNLAPALITARGEP